MAGWAEVIDLGTAAYKPSAAQRRGLIARDGGCIVPGCKRKPRWCEAHHVNPFPNGPTNMSNLVLLCCRHHKQVHHGIIKLVRDDPKGRWTVVRPDGSPLFERPPPRLTASPRSA
jgi:hypothetical protein